MIERNTRTPALLSIGERVWVGLMHVAPLRAYSRLIRSLSRAPMPRSLRERIFGGLAASLSMNLDEADADVSSYRTFGDVFVRRLKPPSRQIDARAEAVISPVDACVSATGRAVAGELIQAKGRTYTLRDLLTDDELATRFAGGAYATLYLRPKDYHRIHAPASGLLKRCLHVPGMLYPVQPSVVRSVDGLFTKNERVILLLETDAGAIVLVCVAAAGVGNITTVVDGELGRPSSRREVTATALQRPVRKGDELAAFNLGSTVILIFERECVDLCSLQVAEEVRMGQTIAWVRQPAAGAGDRDAVSRHAT